VAKGSVWKVVLLLAFVYCIAYFIDVLILVLDNCFKLLCIFFFSSVTFSYNLLKFEIACDFVGVSDDLVIWLVSQKKGSYVDLHVRIM
jgi:hypothetical protein